MYLKGKNMHDRQYLLPSVIRGCFWVDVTQITKGVEFGELAHIMNFGNTLIWIVMCT